MHFHCHNTKRAVVSNESIDGECGDVMLHHALTAGFHTVLDVGHKRARYGPRHLHTPSRHFHQVQEEVVQGQLSADLNTEFLYVFQRSSFPVNLVLGNHGSKLLIGFLWLVWTDFREYLQPRLLPEYEVRIVSKLWLLHHYSYST